MSATVDIQEANGATPDWTTVTAARFCTSDVAVPGSNYSIPIPNTGYRYSFWKTFCLLMSDIGTSINNIRFYSDGAIGWAFGTGGGLFVGTKNSGDSGLAIASYAQSTGTEGLTGNAMGASSGGHPVYKGAGYAVTDVETYTILAPLLVDSAYYTEYGQSKCVVLQVKVDTPANGANQGVQTDEVLSWRYDEI
jgi:hypothetical protein